MITERDFEILRALVRYYVLNRQQIQRLVFPDDQNGRTTRRRLQALIEQNLIGRQSVHFCHPTMTPAPVYFPARRGCELLAEKFDDQRFLVTPNQPPIPHHIFHWLAVSDTHIALDAAIAAQSTVQLENWINEWDVVNRDEERPERRFRLYTLIRENPRLVCAPDAAFQLTVGGHRKAFYVEQDRNTSGVRQIAAGKTQGYAVLNELKLHRRHFPLATVESFSVLMIAPTPRRRDALRSAIASRPGANLWKFVAATDLMPERFLHDSVFYPCVGDPLPLVKPGSIDAIATNTSIEPPTSNSTD